MQDGGNAVRDFTLWYSMQGEPLSMDEFAREYYKDPKARIVQQTSCGPFGFFWVSTVLLGLDHQYGDGPPLIFETMVFPEFELRWPIRREPLMSVPFRLSWTVGLPWRHGSGFDEDRYATLAQAKGGHLDFVEKYSGWRGIKAFFRVLWSGS